MLMRQEETETIEATHPHIDHSPIYKHTNWVQSVLTAERSDPDECTPQMSPHLAHAEQWKEAVELLDTKPALRTAITKRFQLYLKVSFTASNQKTSQATQLLKDFVRYSKEVEEENLDGEMETKTITFFAEDELETLRNYPFEHSRELLSLIHI